MNLSILVKLDPAPEQADSLLHTMEAFNRACSYLAQIAFETGSANKYALQKTAYRTVREQFGLSSQMAVRAISQACEATKSAKTLHLQHVAETKQRNSKRVQKGIPPVDLPDLKPCIFKPHSAMSYDSRIMAWKGLDRVSLLTLFGRVVMPFRFGEYQVAMLQRKRGQADLLFRDGKWFLSVNVDAPEGDPLEPTGVLGVDLGIVNIATDSEGRNYSGAALRAYRERIQSLRSRLQSKGTRSAKRHLRAIRKKQSRHARDVNHCISKELVKTAVAEQKALAFEDLKGIGKRANGLGKQMRKLLGNWAFDQLGFFAEYKSKMYGVLFLKVNPRDTSRTCSRCGYIDEKNRKSQAEFECLKCGYVIAADPNAAKNISARGAMSYALLCQARA